MEIAIFHSYSLTYGPIYFLQEYNGISPPYMSSGWKKHLGVNVLRISYGSMSTQRKGVTDPLRPCGPSLCPLQAPDVRLPKIVTLR